MKNTEDDENQRKSRGLRLIQSYEQKICESKSTQKMKRYINSH